MAEGTAAQPSGWGRIADYMFGRNALIGLASMMLLVISGYATWHGMRDFIIGVSSVPAAPDAGGLSISNDLLVVVVVVALTFLMWLALRETFGAQRRLSERLITAAVGTLSDSGVGVSIRAATTIAKNPLTRLASVNSVGKTATVRSGFMRESQ